MVTIITGNFTQIKAIIHNAGKIHATIATVFLRCFKSKKLIQPIYPNKSEKILVLAAKDVNRLENKTINDPNKKKPFAQTPYASVYIFESVSIISKPAGISPRLYNTAAPNK